MRLADLDSVLAIERQSFPEPWPRRFFEDAVQSDGEPLTWAMVAERGGEVAGYLVAWPVADEIHLGNLAVDPDRRRQGVGQALLDQLVGRARTHGAHAILLEVRAGNRGAITLYARNRFRPLRVRKGYYRGLEDAIVMQRDL